MFQSFDDRRDPEAGAARLGRLRALLRRESLDGFVVPHADEHQSEYLPPSAERLAWLTGFTGSAGTAVVLLEEAAIFVDGRYTLQAAAQVDAGAFQRESVPETAPWRWLAARVKPGQRIGFDPWLLTAAESRRFEAAITGAGAAWVAVEANPIDRIWDDRPAPPVGQVSLQPAAFAGEEAAAKLARLETLYGERADAAVLTQADSIAWTFNIRGSDIGHNPVPLAFAILARGERPALYIDGRKLSNAVRDALEAIAEVRAPGRFREDLAGLAARGAKVLFDPGGSAAAIERVLKDHGASIVEGADPAVLPKARKNAAELAGARRAHLRDGVAMVRFLAWLDGSVEREPVDEIGAAEMLERIRAETAEADGSGLLDLSFDTISAAGPNAALPHYRVDRTSNRRLEPGSVYLVDSGGQYRDGTTDITRTVAVGEPGAEMRDRFTRVLKGHIALATARFPAGTTGVQLDTLARLPLWQAGLDFDHGTGHGVGAFLSVHEGPARIAKTGTVPLEPGMILSDEPGYYRPGAFGIRIENLLAVRAPQRPEGGERDMLSFETLTLCPIDRRLIEPALLDAAETAWLDAYHRRVEEALSPFLAPAEREWLTRATAALAGADRAG
jgi:Xaa-Pro aminopeptidase